MPRPLVMPQHKHDCNACQFLGQYVGEGHKYDLYFCEDGGIVGSVVVYRFGSDGPEYGSMSMPIYKHLQQHAPERVARHPGAAAMKLALQKGLIHEPETV